MDEWLAAESGALRRSWDRHAAAMLRDYLVAGVEDPRINVQSVLTRHFLLAALFGNRWAELRRAELRFAAVMNWFLAHPEALADGESRAAVLHALRRGADNAEGLELPAFLGAVFRELPLRGGGVLVPNYLADLLSPGDPRPQPNPETPAAISPAARASSHSPGERGGECSHTRGQQLLASPPASVFEHAWRTVLDQETPASAPLTVLEPACGSANDYRSWDRFGFTRHVAYTGLDISEKNVANARALFPEARFEVGNVLALDVADRAFDCVVVQDLLEHHSPRALPVAVRELGRVARAALCVGFFSMEETGDHVVRPVDDYHWNTLSMGRTRALFAAEGFDATVLHIGSFLRWLTGQGETHNPHAYTFVLARGRQDGECRATTTPGAVA